MVTQKEVLFGVVAPVVIAFVVMLIAWRPWRGSLKSAGSWGGAVGLAMAYIVAQLGLYGMPKFQIRPVEHWLVVIALIGMIVGLIESFRRGPWWGRLAWRLIAAAGGVWLIVRLQVVNQAWTAGECAAWTAGLACAVVVFWSMVDALAERVDRSGGGAGAALVMSGVVGLSGVIIILDGQTLLIGQFAGALALALLACAATGLWRKRATIARGGVAVVGLLAPMFWLDAWLWAELSWWYMVAFALSPALALAGDLPLVRAWRGWMRTLVRVGAVALPLMALAGMEIKQAMDEEKARQELGY